MTLKRWFGGMIAPKVRPWDSRRACAKPATISHTLEAEAFYERANLATSHIHSLRTVLAESQLHFGVGDCGNRGSLRPKTFHFD